MSSTNHVENNAEVAKEIFNQLNASKVNAFPFFAYTGIKASIFSATELHLKCPRNPGNVKNVLISYEYGSDTYTIVFNGSDRLDDVYADAMVEIIVRKMGVL